MNQKFEFEFEKYITTPETIMDTINQYGVAIVPCVLDENECKKMISGMWDTLEKLSTTWDLPIHRDNPVSWRNIRQLFPLHSMLIQHWSIGHAQFIWELRQNPKCVDIFAKIWNTEPEDLLTSFDAASFHMPSETTKIGWHRSTWYHSDQSFVEKGFRCVQSWVTGFDVNEGDATLAFYERSNNYHTEFGEAFNVTDTSNWYKMDSVEKINFYKERGCVEMRIKCPAGSMVLWDSRTIHCGSEPIKGRAQPNFRCVAYLCYMPRHMATQKKIDKKIKAFNEMRMTTHWPCEVKLFAKKPRTYGAEVSEITLLERPEISDLGRRLVGYN
jgi:hypothetical protein